MTADGTPGSPKLTTQTQQRCKIISPRRQKFEKQFEKYLDGKYIVEPIQSIPDKRQQLLVPPEFDIRTKAGNSQNVRVSHN
jgi:hypothetical protein